MLIGCSVIVSTGKKDIVNNSAQNTNIIQKYLGNSCSSDEAEHHYFILK